MKRKAKIIVLGLGAVTLLGGSLVACGHKYKDPEQRAEWITDKVASKLELNQEQRAHLDKLSDTILKAKETHIKDKEQSRQEVLAMLKEKTFDQGKALAMVKEKTSFVEQQAPAVISAYAELHDTLSDEQRAQISEHLSEHFERHNRYRWGHH